MKLTIHLTLLLLLVLGFISNIFADSNPYLGTSIEDFQKEGVSPNKIEAWEDGLRTTTEPGTYEWWYFDGHMEDGTKVVVVYYTKSLYRPMDPFTPSISITITSPEGDVYYKYKAFTAKSAFFATDKCDIRIGGNAVSGDLTNYQIYASIDDLAVDLNLRRMVPSWRPGNGHVYFGEEKTQKYFAWLPSVPNGEMTGTISYNGETHSVQGSGYHDHNWGNAALSSLLKNWWWTRVQVDDYTLIGAELRTRDEYGDIKLPLFAAITPEQIIADKAFENTTMELKESNFAIHPDPGSNELIARQLNFNYEQEDKLIVNLDLQLNEMIGSKDLLKLSTLSDEEIAAVKKAGASPWYTRFSSTATINIIERLNKGFSFVTADGFAVTEKMDFE